ncbi:CBS domain containing membrane protein [Desulfosarcina cetonica]|nr:CBS domain containing membrane protein [Desulfosarcina cetonica]
MLIRYWMSKPAITIEKDQSMQQALALIKEKRIRLLPVTDAGKLCGVVSDRDLKRASASDATSLDVHELLFLISKIKVSEIMTREVITVHQDWSIEEAADLMLHHKISGAPVIDDDGAIVGVITQSDMFRATLYLTGLKKRGFQIALVLEDTPGSIMEIVNVIRQFGGRMASILSTYERAPNGYRNVYLRFYEVSRDRIEEMLDVLRQKAKLRYLVDHRENRRIVFDKL